MTFNATRSKVVGSLIPETTVWWEYIDGAPNSGPYTAETGIHYYGHIGENIENYVRRRQSGELLPFTSWYQRSCEGICVSSTVVNTSSHVYTIVPYRDISKGQWIIREQEISDLVSYLNLEELGQTHVTAAAAKIYGSGFDALTWVAELKKTVKMFRQLLKSLYTAATRPEKLYNQWLEGRYGWRILVYEMIELSQVIANLNSELVRFKERSGQGGEHSESFVQSWVGGYGTYQNIFVNEYKWSVRGSIVSDVNPPDFAFNPITTSWELIPFSFVVDWVIGVGSWLESMSFLAISDKYAAATGYTLKYTRRSAGSSLTPNSGWTVQSINLVSNCTWEITSRAPSTVSILPQTGLRIDGLKVMDLVALVLQAIHRR